MLYRRVRASVMNSSLGDVAVGKWIETLIYAGAFVLLLAIIGAMFSFRSFMEARAFNRLTGANVSTWDAIWVELRVDIPVRMKE